MSKYEEFFKHFSTNQIISKWRINDYIKIINGINSFIKCLKFEKFMFQKSFYTSENNNFNLPIIDNYKKIYKNITKFKILYHIHLLDFYNTYSDSDLKYKSIQDYNFYFCYLKKKYKKIYIL